MKVKKKEIGLLVIVLGLLAAFASYWFAYRNFEAEAEIIKTENTELQATVDKLEILEARRPQYLESIELMKAADSMVINSFASNVLREDQIMYLYNMELVAANEVKVPSVSMSAATEVSYAGSTTTEEGYELVNDGIGMYRLDSVSSITTTNNGLKNILNYIYDIDSRKAITTVSLTTTTDGYLSGNVGISFYYLTGTEKPYVEQNIQGVPTGTSNFFGVLDGGQYRNNGLDEDEGSPEDESDSEENE